MENSCLDGRIILKRMGSEKVDLINLAQDRVKLGAVPNMAINFRVAHTAGNFLTSC